MAQSHQGSFNMEWPEHFPPNCPDEACTDPNGKYYRLVKSIDISESDFKPSPTVPDESFGDPDCIMCGISIEAKISGARKIIRRYKNHRNDLIAMAELRSGMGKVKITPPSSDSHYTWWIPKGFEPEKLFSIIDE